MAFSGLPSEADCAAQLYAQEWVLTDTKIVVKFIVLALGERHAIEQGHRRIYGMCTRDAVLRRNIAQMPWSMELMAHVLHIETVGESVSRQDLFDGPLYRRA